MHHSLSVLPGSGSMTHFCSLAYIPLSGTVVLVNIDLCPSGLLSFQSAIHPFLGASKSCGLRTYSRQTWPSPVGRVMVCGYLCARRKYVFDVIRSSIWLSQGQ